MKLTETLKGMKIGEARTFDSDGASRAWTVVRTSKSLWDIPDDKLGLRRGNAAQVANELDWEGIRA